MGTKSKVNMTEGAIGRPRICEKLFVFPEQVLESQPACVNTKHWDGGILAAFWRIAKWN